jgi:hypothetical protein
VSQEHVSNLNAPVRIGSSGGSGSTTQANTALAVSLAANGNKTDQDANQTQSGAGTLVQGVGQLAKNDQDATSCANTSQKGAKNTNAPLRIGSEGTDGSTSQANTAAALSAALNGNKTEQDAGQTQSGAPGSAYVQGVGQGAFSKQGALSNADTKQHGVANESTPLRIDRPEHKRCEPKQPCESKPKVGPPDYRCDASSRNGGSCHQPVKEPKCPREEPKCPPRRPAKPCASCEKPHDPCDKPKCPPNPRKERMNG